MDLGQATYEEFLQFVFDHYPEDEVDDKWYWKLDVELDIPPRRAIELLTRVCANAGELLNQYTPRQIAEGMEFLFGPAVTSPFRDQLWNPDVPWTDRRRCILSIPQLYTQVLETEPDGVGGCAYMLWDIIAYDYYCGNRDPGSNVEDSRVQDAMFDALTSMLKSTHPETQRGALHGLGHLCHRRSSDAIRQFLSSNRAISLDVRTYAGAVLEGTFQ